MQSSEPLSSDTPDEIVARAAAHCGVEPEFWDIWGKKHYTSPEANRAILRALQFPADDAEALAAALAGEQTREAEALLPPLLVVTAGVTTPWTFPFTAPRRASAVTVEIALETGVRISESHALAALRLRGPLTERGFRPLEAPLPTGIPLGYHRLQIALDTGDSASIPFIVTPERAYTPDFLNKGGKGAGVCISLYGLRSERNWGCGDLRDLYGVIDWIADDIGGSFVGLNPLHALHNRRPYNTSPYLPNCVYYQNPIYLDVETVPGFDSQRVAAALNSPALRGELHALRATDFVEYERVYALKLKFLKLAFLEFLRAYRAGATLGQEFAEYARREGDLLERYAVYCALDEHIHGRNPDVWIWADWPEEFRDPESPAVQRFAKRYWRRVLFYKFLQWQLFKQLAAAQQYARQRGLPIGLYNDLALATDRCGSDLWAHRDSFVPGCRVGAPPDGFSPQGQDWGFPPPNVRRHRETGYRLFIESIRKNCRYGGALRLDHVMRFFRLYWIPESMDATQGAYVRDHYDELLGILALESVRNKVLVVGEDLGTVEPAVRSELQRRGILSYRLLYFERDGGGFRLPQDYPSQALVSVTTHDLPTLAGYWSGEDIMARRRTGLLPDDGHFRQQMEDRIRDKRAMLNAIEAAGLLPHWIPRHVLEGTELGGDLHNAIIGYLARTPSMLFAINQEDLTKEEAQQNLPGSTHQYPNWSRKMKFRVEELRTNQAAKDFTAMFRNWLDRTGRRNVTPRAD